MTQLEKVLYTAHIHTTVAATARPAARTDASTSNCRPQAPREAARTRSNCSPPAGRPAS